MFRLVGDVLTEEVAVLVAAIVVAVVSVFRLVAAMEVTHNLIADVETHRVLGVEDGVVAEHLPVGRVFHRGFRAELQVGVGAAVEAVADAQIEIMAAAWGVHL